MPPWTCPGPALGLPWPLPVVWDVGLLLGILMVVCSWPCLVALEGGFVGLRWWGCCLVFEWSFVLGRAYRGPGGGGFGAYMKR